MTPAEFEQEAAFLGELEDFLREKGDEEGLLLAVKAHANLQLMLDPILDSSDEEIIEVLLPVQELTRERDELRARIKELEAERDSLLMTSLSRFDEIELLGRERDELREQFNQYVRGAETEANELRADLQGLMDESAASTEAMDRARKEIDSLRAYNEMLLKVEREHVAEVERLTVAAHRFEEEARQATFEVERLRAIEMAARAYCDVPIDDVDAGALYRALCETLRRPTYDE